MVSREDHSIRLGYRRNTPLKIYFTYIFLYIAGRRWTNHRLCVDKLVPGCITLALLGRLHGIYSNYEVKYLCMCVWTDAPFAIPTASQSNCFLPTYVCGYRTGILLDKMKCPLH